MRKIEIKEKTQITNIRNEKGITLDILDIKKIIRDNILKRISKFQIFEEIIKFLKKYKLSELTRRKRKLK